MTTHFEDKAELLKLKRTKVKGMGQDHKIMHVPVAEIPCKTVKKEGVIVGFDLDANGNEIPCGGDRIVLLGEVFDVMANSTINGDTMSVTAAKNDFETGMLALQDANCDVRWGHLIPTHKDDATEAFMDSWVGTYILNIVAHYDEIRNGRSLGSFFGLFNHDVPCAIVGAGPSLDHNGHFLKNFPGLIICADRAYKHLIAEGVEPDLVMSVDCHIDHVANMLKCPRNKRHALLVNTCADPRVSQEWKGDIFWYNMRHPGVQFPDRILPALFPTFDSIPNLGNVGNSSVWMADHMGCSPLVLVGQDYGYTGGRAHARDYEFDADGIPTLIDTDHGKKLEERSGKLEMNGVITYVAYPGYALTMAKLAKDLRIDVINATEGGIITDFKQQMLEETSKSLENKRGIAYSARMRLGNAIKGGDEHVRSTS